MVVASYCIAPAFFSLSSRKYRFYANRVRLPVFRNANFSLLHPLAGETGNNQGNPA